MSDTDANTVVNEPVSEPQEQEEQEEQVQAQEVQAQEVQQPAEAEAEAQAQAETEQVPQPPPEVANGDADVPPPPPPQEPAVAQPQAQPQTQPQAQAQQSAASFIPVTSEPEYVRNLIVNYLPLSVSEDAVKQMFLPYGVIERCHLMTDMGTGASRGFAFVKYSNSAEAQAAIKALNGYELGNKRVKVSLARPDGKPPPASTLGGVVQEFNLYVSGFDQQLTEGDLRGMFTPFGDVVEARVLIDKATGVSRGCGFVRFTYQQEADKAIAGLNGVTTKSGSSLTVRYADSTKRKLGMGGAAARQGGPMGGMQMMMPMMHGMMPMMGMRPGAGGPMSAAHFSPYGVSGAAGANPYGAANPYGGGAPQGAQGGMAAYNSQLAAAAAAGQQAVSAMGGGQGGYGANPYMAGVPNPAQFAAASAQQGGNRGIPLFVYNLGREADEHFLQQLFAPFGTVYEATIVRDPTHGGCKGYGFVHMGSPQEAQAAIMGTNGATVGGRVLQVSLKGARK